MLGLGTKPALHAAGGGSAWQAVGRRGGEGPATQKSYEELAKQLDRLAFEARELAGRLSSSSKQGHDTKDVQVLPGNERSMPGLEHGVQDSRAEGGADACNDVPAKRRRKKAKKEFDMSTYHQRLIALEILYVGWGFVGSTFQQAEPNTVEGALLRALAQTRLTADDATLETLQLSRSGRTDKGVSGVGQVIALRVRSSGKADRPLPPSDQECDFPATLNKALPPEIRILGWTDVSSNFSARFSAKYREYRYFIPCENSLDLTAMQQAAAHFVGEHDFRNFCKADAEHVNHFVRHILDFRVEEMAGCSFGRFRILRLHIRGSAFLWHQVRCMVAVLHLVGRRLEQPEIVRKLLDVGSWGDKPQYNMAAEEPLLFFSCGYEDLHFRRTAACVTSNSTAVEALLTKQLAGAALLHTLAEKLRDQARGVGLETTASGAKKPEKHIALTERPRELALEAKFAKFGRTLSRPGKREVAVAGR